MLGFKKKMDFVDRDEVLRAKNETIRLTTQFSYEDIGRAFVAATRDLSYDDLDDVVKARFVNMVSFKCTMNLLARVRRPGPELPELTEADEIAKRFCDEIEALGVFYKVDESGGIFSEGDPSWIELAPIYFRACKHLNREPQIRRFGQ